LDVFFGCFYFGVVGVFSFVFSLFEILVYKVDLVFIVDDECYFVVIIVVFDYVIVELIYCFVIECR